MCKRIISSWEGNFRSMVFLFKSVVFHAKCRKLLDAQSYPFISKKFFFLQTSPIKLFSIFHKVSRFAVSLNRIFSDIGNNPVNSTIIWSMVVDFIMGLYILFLLSVLNFMAITSKQFNKINGQKCCAFIRYA